MSFIRAGSSPEQYYVWGDGVRIWFDDHTIPVDIWDEAVTKWVEHFETDTKHKGFSIIDDKPGIKITWDGNEICAKPWTEKMYDVTWYYIVDRYMKCPHCSYSRSDSPSDLDVAVKVASK